MKRRPKCQWCPRRPQHGSLLCLECNLFNQAVRSGLKSTDRRELMTLGLLGEHMPKAVAELSMRLDVAPDDDVSLRP